MCFSKSLDEKLRIGVIRLFKGFFILHFFQRQHCVFLQLIVKRVNALQKMSLNLGFISLGGNILFLIRSGWPDCFNSGVFVFQPRNGQQNNIF